MIQLPTFRQRVAELICPVAQHEKQEIVAICVYPECNKPDRWACVYCLQDHRDHQNHMITILDVENMLKKDINLGSMGIRNFKAFKANILQQLQQLENTAMEEEAKESTLNKIYKMEAPSHQTLNELGTILSEQVRLRNNKIEEAATEFQQNLDNQYQKILENLNQIAVQIGTQQLPTRFSNALKPPEVALDKYDTIIKSTREQFSFCLSVDPVPWTHTTRWVRQINFISFIQSYKILQQTRRVMIGLYSKSAAEENRFVSWGNRKGIYMIFSNGHAYQESQPNFTISDIEFTTNDLIECEFNPIVKQLTAMNPRSGKRYTFSIDRAEEDLHICAFVCQVGDSVKLLPSTANW